MVMLGFSACFTTTRGELQEHQPKAILAGTNINAIISSFFILNPSLVIRRFVLVTHGNNHREIEPFRRL